MERDGVKERLRVLGERIRDRRIEQNLSQEKLGMMINSGQSYIYRLEGGKVSVGVETLIKVADALDIEVRELFSF